MYEVSVTCYLLSVILYRDVSRLLECLGLWEIIILIIIFMIYFHSLISLFEIVGNAPTQTLSFVSNM